MNLIKFRYSININSKFKDNFIFSHFFILIRNLEYNLNESLITNIIAQYFLVTCSLKTEEIENNKKKYFDKLDKVLKSQFNFYFHYENSPKYHLFLIKQILDLEILKKIVGKKNNNKNIL